MSQKRKVAFADEEENDYRRARVYAKLEESVDRSSDDVNSGPPPAETKHTLDSDEEDNPDKHEKLRLDDIAGVQLLLSLRCCCYPAWHLYFVTGGTGEVYWRWRITHGRGPTRSYIIYEAGSSS